MGLIHLLFDLKGSLDGKKKAELVRSIHEKACYQIEKKNEHYASQANRVTFEPVDWVWMHIRKERFQLKGGQN